MNKDKIKFDFTAFGQAIKAARKARGYSRNALADEMNIAPLYIASIANRWQLDSLLDDISDKGLRIVTARVKEGKEV